MKFMMRAELTDVTADVAVTWRPARGEGYERYELVPRDQLAAYAEAAGPAAGQWAFEALRIARGEPRFGVDTDARTIPNEVGWINSAVHMDKGCYRGQETVARVHNLGRPPRRLTLLHLDGSDNRLPAQGSDLVLNLGYSHDLHFPIPAGIKITVAENTKIKIEGIDRQLVGQVASDIRSYYPPEPYKGKGVRYAGEHIQRKEGKTVQ